MSDEEFAFPAPRYSHFVQAVRRFRPSQLIPLLAKMTVRDDPNYRNFEEVRRLPPWSIAAIARESIVRGNEFRSTTATEADVNKLAQLHHQVFVEPTRQTLMAIIGPLMHEQLWWQISLFEEQTRAISLFEDPAYGPSFEWEEALGLPLGDAVRASFLVGLAINKNGGRWEPGILDRVYDDPRIERHAPRASVERTALLLTSSSEKLKAIGTSWDQRDDREPEIEKHPLNPLMGEPIVDLGAAGAWAPVAPLAWRALLPAGLYVRGRQQWGQPFTEELGHRYEKYVGALLSNVAPNLLSEVRYGKGGGKASIDWVWITPKAVVLVECKSAGLSVDSMGGGGRFPDLVRRAIIHPREQIDRAAAAIRSGIPGFEKIPSDRPIYGLIVTSDPFPFANANLTEYGPHGDTPTLVASVRAIEHLTSAKNAIHHLLEVFEDEERKRWDLEQAIKHVKAKRHPVSERAWKRIGPMLPPQTARRSH